MPSVPAAASARSPGGGVMTARTVAEASFNATVTRYLEARADGTPDRVARPILIDQLLKIADRYAHGAAAMRRRDQGHAARIEAALATIKQGTAS